MSENIHSEDYIGYFEALEGDSPNPINIFFTEEDFVENNTNYKIVGTYFFKHSTENGKKINQEDLEALKKVLEKEKFLQKELKNLKRFLKEWHSGKEHLKKYFE